MYSSKEDSNDASLYRDLKLKRKKLSFHAWRKTESEGFGTQSDIDASDTSVYTSNSECDDRPPSSLCDNISTLDGVQDKTEHSHYNTSESFCSRAKNDFKSQFNRTLSDLKDHDQTSVADDFSSSGLNLVTHLRGVPSNVFAPSQHGLNDVFYQANAQHMQQYSRHFSAAPSSTSNDNRNNLSNNSTARPSSHPYPMSDFQRMTFPQTIIASAAQVPNSVSHAQTQGIETQPFFTSGQVQVTDIGSRSPLLNKSVQPQVIAMASPSQDGVPKMIALMPGRDDKLRMVALPVVNWPYLPVINNLSLSSSGNETSDSGFETENEATRRTPINASIKGFSVTNVSQMNDLLNQPSLNNVGGATFNSSPIPQSTYSHMKPANNSLNSIDSVVDMKSEHRPTVSMPANPPIIISSSPESHTLPTIGQNLSLSVPPMLGCNGATPRTMSEGMTTESIVSRPSALKGVFYSEGAQTGHLLHQVKPPHSPKTACTGLTSANQTTATSVSFTQQYYKPIINIANDEPDHLMVCAICEDKATGLHYGIVTCEGCKGFFKRTVQNKRVYTCMTGGLCDVHKQHRTRCSYCRFKKCLQKGMVLAAVREDRMPGGRNSRTLYNNSKIKYRKSRKRMADCRINGQHLDVEMRDTPASASSGHVAHTTPPVHSRLVPNYKQLIQELMESEKSQDIVNFHFPVQAKDGHESKPISKTLSELGDNIVCQLVRWMRHLPFYTEIPLPVHTKILTSRWHELLLLTMAAHYGESVTDANTAELSAAHCSAKDSLGSIECMDNNSPDGTLLKTMFQDKCSPSGLVTGKTMVWPVLEESSLSPEIFKKVLNRNMHKLHSYMTSMLKRNISIDELGKEVGSMIDKITHVLQVFHMMNVTTEEYVCLKVILLLNYVECEEPMILSEIQDRYMTTLQAHIESVNRSNSNRFGELLLLLPQVQTAAKLLLKNKMIWVPFLLNSK